MWVEIRSSNKKFLLCVIYRANSNTSFAFWDQLQDNINMITANYSGNIMIVGDLNADFKTHHGKCLRNFVEANNLTLHVQSPTRITETSSSILDQIITNFPNHVYDVKVECPISMCDHSVISAKCNLKTNKGHSFKREVRTYNDESLENFMHNVTSYTWKCVTMDDSNEACDSFTDEFLNLAKLSIPSKQVTIRVNDKPWFTTTLRQLKRKCMRKYNLFKKNRNSETWQTYKELQKEYHKNLIKSKTEFETNTYRKLIESGAKNSKLWWRLTKNILKADNKSDSIPTLETDEKCIDNDEDKAEAFNEFFLRMSTLDNSDGDLPEERNIINHNSLDTIDITEEDVLDQLKNLDTNKALGPDGISPRLLKIAAKPISKILQYIFNLSIKTSKFPSAWKKANVVPIHKKGDKSVIDNYRPVSLLSVVAKVFERIVFKYVYNHFRDNFVISVYQSGFLPGCSTVTQLLEVYHHFCRAVDEGKEIRVVFLDISKAFDKVWHAGLLHKLQLCGIGGELLRWFSSYLADRQQRVVINGKNSNWGSIDAGVPQGSVLGPLLFLIYINDLTHVIRYSKIRLFADDTCLFIEVNDRALTAKQIESDLTSIGIWAKKWRVSFSAQKTKSLTISNKRDAHHNPSIKFMGSDIEEVCEHKYLGLIFSNNLKWNAHIDSICMKARKRLSIVQPLKFKIDRKSLETIYFSFILPVMEYAYVVWGGSCDTQLAKIEKIHVDAMRLVTGATSRSNIQRLYTETGWLSVKSRIDRAMIIMLFKIINQQSPNYLFELLPSNNAASINYSLRNRDNIKMPNCQKESFRRSFLPSAIRLWNKLEKNVRDAPSILSLKLELKKKHPDKPTLYYYGHRWPSVHHSRMRMQCSKLNYDLYCKLYVLDNPSCQCGASRETARHFFMECPLYDNIRGKLFTTVTNHAACSVDTFLFGEPSLQSEENRSIFDAVHEYICESKRFD